MATATPEIAQRVPLTGIVMVRDGCVLVAGRPVIWPAGTRWDAGVRLPDGRSLPAGRVVSVTVGIVPVARAEQYLDAQGTAHLRACAPGQEDAAVLDPTSAITLSSPNRGSAPSSPA